MRSIMTVIGRYFWNSRIGNAVFYDGYWSVHFAVLESAMLSSMTAIGRYCNQSSYWQCRLFATVIGRYCKRHSYWQYRLYDGYWSVPPKHDLRLNLLTEEHSTNEKISERFVNVSHSTVLGPLNER